MAQAQRDEEEETPSRGDAPTLSLADQQQQLFNALQASVRSQNEDALRRAVVDDVDAGVVRGVLRGRSASAPRGLRWRYRRIEGAL